MKHQARLASLALCLLAVACSKPTDSGKKTGDGKKSKSGDDDSPKKKKVSVSLPDAVKFEKPEPMQFDGKKVKAEVCKLDDRGKEMTSEDFSGAIGDIALVPDGSVYVIDPQAKLRHYLVQSDSPCELALDDDFGKGGVLSLDSDAEKAKNYNALAVDGKGHLFVSGWGPPKKLSKDGKLKAICGDASGKLVIDPSTGDAYVGRAHAKIDGEDCTVDSKDAVFDAYKDTPEIDGAGGGKVFVFGGVGKIDQVGVYKHDGKKVALFGKKDGDEDICNVHGIAACRFGVCVYDANCRSLRVWSADGSNFLGAGDLNKVVGLTYIWPVGITVGKDAAFMSFTQEQTDKPKGDEKSKYYGFIARVTGLN